MQLVIVSILVFMLGDAVHADVTLNGTAAGHGISMSTRSRTASAVHSLIWNGRQFIDDFDHGRQLQSATNHGIVGEAFCAEGYNPTQAGSANDGAGSISTSTVVTEQVVGNQLLTSGDMAFWLAPGQSNPWGCTAYNTTLLSDHRVSTTYTLGVNVSGSLIDNLIRHEVTFDLPSDPNVQFFYHQMEALTGYMPPSFSKFRTWNPVTNQLSVITPPNAEQGLPVIISTPDDQFAMGVYSFDLPQSTYPGAGYGAVFFPNAYSDEGPGAGVSKWNVVYREGNPNLPGNIQTQTSLSYTNYLAVGTVENVHNSLAALVGLIDPGPGGTPIAVEDFGFEDGGSALGTLGQGAHARWIVDSFLPGDDGFLAVPDGSPYALLGVEPTEGDVMAYTRSQPMSGGDPDGTPLVIRNVTEHLAAVGTYTLKVDATTLNLGPGNGYVLELGYQNNGSNSAADFVPIADLDSTWSGITPGTFEELSLEAVISAGNLAMGFPLAIRWTNKAEEQAGSVNNAYIDNVRLWASFAFSAADFNQDGSVNRQDLVIWENAYGVNANGDADGDGDSDGVDFLQWQRELDANSRLAASRASAATVPEPSASVLLITISMGIAAFCRDRDVLLE